jgi:hypothetical protein
MSALVENQEVIFDDVRLITETEDKVAMAIVAVILHNLSQTPSRADGHHRLGNVFRVFSEAGSKIAPKSTTFMVPFS